MCSGLGEAAHRCPDALLKAVGLYLSPAPPPAAPAGGAEARTAQTVERERARGSRNKSAVLTPFQGQVCQSIQLKKMLHK